MVDEVDQGHRAGAMTEPELSDVGGRAVRRDRDGIGVFADLDGSSQRCGSGIDQDHRAIRNVALDIAAPSDDVGGLAVRRDRDGIGVHPSTWPPAMIGAPTVGVGGRGSISGITVPKLKMSAGSTSPVVGDIGGLAVRRDRDGRGVNLGGEPDRFADGGGGGREIHRGGRAREVVARGHRAAELREVSKGIERLVGVGDVGGLAVRRDRDGIGVRAMGADVGDLDWCRRRSK